MSQPSTSQARVIDPILTEVAQGYKHPMMVGSALFPAVPVMQRGGKIITFGKEDFQLYATGRAPGANTKRVQYGHASGNYSLDQHALEGLVPFEIMEEADRVPGIDMANVAIRKTQNIIALRTEKEQADLARDANQYDANHKVTLSGTSQWSDFGSTSKPISDVRDAKEAVRATTGMDANTVVMGAKVFAKLSDHPTVIDRIKFTGRDSATPELLASLFGVERVLVGRAIYADSAGDFADIWGNDVVVAYTDVSGLADMGSPSYGYTYQLGGYPIVEEPYQDRNAKSWIYPVTDEVDPVIASALAGFVIKAAVA